MPKVTESYRESRRDEIAEAAMRCLFRKGFARTSMADIIAESGLSAGAIYSHFTSKAEIAHHVARIVITTRGEELHAYAASLDRPITPAEIIAFMMVAIDRQGVAKSIVVQLWAEATVDAEMHEMIVETMGRIRASYVDELRPWLEARNGGPVSGEDVAEAASTMITLSQGYITRTAVFGDEDPHAYLAAAGALLA